MGHYEYEAANGQRYTDSNPSTGKHIEGYRCVYVEDKPTVRWSGPDVDYRAVYTGPAVPLTGTQKFVLSLIGIGICTVFAVAILGTLVRLSVPTPSISKGVATYTADQLQPFSWLPWAGERTFQFSAKNVVISGNTSDVKIITDGNITFTGVLRNSEVNAKGTIRTKDTYDTRLTGWEVLVFGPAFRTIETNTFSTARKK